MSTAAVEETPSRRGPGRPRKTEGEKEMVRAEILAATERVFSRHVARDVTVTRIIAEAGLTRPSFYRYFANADEPLGILLEEFVDSLVRELTATLDPLPEGDDALRLSLGFDVYLEWSRRNRHLLPSFVADLQNPSSPVSRIRQRGVDEVTVLLERQFDGNARPRPDRTLLDVFVTSIEYTCFRFHLDTDGGPEAMERAKIVMLRMALALLTDDPWTASE